MISLIDSLVNFCFYIIWTMTNSCCETCQMAKLLPKQQQKKKSTITQH